ncbi:MAG: hypothetical protein NVS4B3_28680 [Gemmatimonadaceae bacterium]
MDDVDFLPGALSCVSDDQDVLALRIESDAPGIAQAEGVDFWEATADERMVREDGVGHPPIHINAKNLSEQVVG